VLRILSDSPRIAETRPDEQGSPNAQKECCVGPVPTGRRALAIVPVNLRNSDDSAPAVCNSIVERLSPIVPSPLAREHPHQEQLRTNAQHCVALRRRRAAGAAYESQSAGGNRPYEGGSPNARQECCVGPVPTGRSALAFVPVNLRNSDDSAPAVCNSIVERLSPIVPSPLAREHAHQKQLRTIAQHCVALRRRRAAGAAYESQSAGGNRPYEGGSPNVRNERCRSGSHRTERSGDCPGESQEQRRFGTGNVQLHCRTIVPNRSFAPGP